MKLHLNLITLALVTMSGTAMANYGLSNANTSKVNLDKWQCKKCVSNEGLRGNITVGAGFVDSDDQHADNAFNGTDDGGAYQLDANLGYQRAGHEANLTTYGLGSKHGVASLSMGKSGVAMFTADYANYTHYNAKAETMYVPQGSNLVNQGELVEQDLETERERFGFGLEGNIGMVETYAKYQTEDKTGKTIASISGLSATNVVAPIDSTTERWEAGAKLVGANWFTGVTYIYSEYDNNLNTAMDFGGYQDALAYSPSNDAYQVMLNGAYQFGRSNIAGRVVTGQMNQTSGLVAQPTIAGFDGEVETLDANLKLTTLATNKLRLTAGFDYSDRDNKSTILAGPNFEVDPINGTIEEATLLDTTKTKVDVGASYRIASGYRLTGGYQYELKQRTAEGYEEEETKDHAGEVKLRVTAFDKWDIALQGGYSHRDLSEYDANRLTSGEDNALLRRYNLAERDRTEAKLAVSFNPVERLALDLNGHWAQDDYDETEIGLTEGEDYGFDVGINYQHGAANWHAFAGKQWINTEQNGSNNGGSANWNADVEDEYDHIGAGVDYQISRDALIGLNYLYADSTSDTLVSQGVSVPYDDYFATSHSINVFAEMAVGEGMAVRLDYQYERFEETDYGNVEPGSVNNLTTLGNLDHNYHAHLIMLSFSYDL